MLLFLKIKSEENCLSWINLSRKPEPTWQIWLLVPYQRQFKNIIFSSLQLLNTLTKRFKNDNIAKRVRRWHCHYCQFLFKWGLIEFGKGRFLKAINAFARNVSLTFSNLTIITYRNHALNWSRFVDDLIWPFNKPKVFQFVFSHRKF